MQTTASIGTVLTTLKSGFASASSQTVVLGPQRDYTREQINIMDVTTPGDQEWALLGNQQRREVYSVNAVLVAGDPRYRTFDAQIGQAFTTFGTLETWLRANVDLGLSATFTDIRAEVSRVGVQQYPAPDDGHPVVEIEFSVLVKTRI